MQIPAKHANAVAAASTSFRYLIRPLFGRTQLTGMLPFANSRSWPDADSGSQNHHLRLVVTDLRNAAREIEYVCDQFSGMR